MDSGTEIFDYSTFLQTQESFIITKARKKIIGEQCLPETRGFFDPIICPSVIRFR